MGLKALKRGAVRTRGLVETEGHGGLGQLVAVKSEQEYRLEKMVLVHRVKRKLHKRRRGRVAGGLGLKMRSLEVGRLLRIYASVGHTPRESA